MDSNRVLFYITVYNTYYSMVLMDETCQPFLRKLISACRSNDASLHAYCILPTVFHCLIDIDLPQLSSIASALRKIWKGVSNDTSIEQSIVRARPVEKNRFAYDLSLFIHALPVFCGIVVVPEEYIWSSFYSYIYPRCADDLVCVEDILCLSVGRVSLNNKKRKYQSDLQEFIKRNWQNVFSYASAESFGSRLFREFVESYMKSYDCKNVVQEKPMQFYPGQYAR